MLPATIHEYRRLVLSPQGPRGALARLVAITVTMQIDSRSLETGAGAALIAERAGMSERATRTYLGQLVRDGWLTERTQGRGRDFWLKVRRLNIPDGLEVPARHAGSRSSRHPAPRAGSDPSCPPHPAPHAGSHSKSGRHPAPDAGLPARDDSTPCTGALGDPARRADDLVLRSSSKIVPNPARTPAREAGARARIEPEPDHGTARLDRIRKTIAGFPDYSDDDIAKLLKQFGVVSTDVAQLRATMSSQESAT